MNSNTQAPPIDQQWANVTNGHAQHDPSAGQLGYRTDEVAVLRYYGNDGRLRYSMYSLEADMSSEAYLVSDTIRPLDASTC